MRGKFRKSFVEPEPFVPGEVTAVEFDLRDKFHRFQKGHRIMVQVQSSWFPVIDRNPQRFVDIFTAEEADFQKATHRVYCSASQPSHLKLNVLPVN
jgi:predicted acyl esterase